MVQVRWSFKNLLLVELYSPAVLLLVGIAGAVSNVEVEKSLLFAACSPDASQGFGGEGILKHLLLHSFKCDTGKGILGERNYT